MHDDGKWMLYAVPGWGSALVDAMLAWCGAHHELIDVAGFDRPGAARDRLLVVNPLAQVPTVVLPDGEVMTESAAIALLVAEIFPDAGLAPAPGSRRRPEYLRRLVWLGSTLYPTFTFGDYPERWVAADRDAFKQRVLSYRQGLWSMFEATLPDASWTLGHDFSALDLFVCVMTRWSPGRAWFGDHCPRLFRIASAVDELGPLREVWQRNFARAPT